MKFILLLVFLAFTGIAVSYIYNELKHKETNKGFLAVAVAVAAGDLMCAVYVLTRNSAACEPVLMIYQLVHSWLMPAVALMIVVTVKYTVRNKRADVTVLPVVTIALIRSVAVVLEGVHYEGPELRLRSILFYICVVLTGYVLIRYLRVCPKLFRFRYASFASIIILLAVIEIITETVPLPVWVGGIIYNILIPFGAYLTGEYASRRIRDWSLDNFADNMSDGLILYDMTDKPIHINAMIRRSIRAELLRQFSDRSKLDEWLGNMTDMESSQVLKYEGPDRVYYFKPHVQELTDNDIRIGTLYILHDHSESYNRIRSMRKANEELERAGRMKSDFLANMSHEIRTPMNAVIGMAEIAIREDDPERVNDYLRQIQSSGKNLLNIINDILDYSKIESGKMEIIEDAYSPFEEISDIANVLSVRVGDKPVELFVLCEDELPHKLIGDAMRIRQVLINLANNAIKFTNEGSVRVCVSSRQLNDNHVELTYHVVDTGIGIRDEDKSKLFDSFQQLDSKRNRSVEGTGLGLVISRRLVGAMGGEMGLESEYGKGSDFWFTIPQKIKDARNDIQVEGADDKYAYILTETPERSTELVAGLDRLGVTNRVIDKLDEYEPTDHTEFMFIESEKYDDKMRSFLIAHPDIRGIVLAGQTEDIDEDVANLHVIRKPRTTMNIVNSLNERYEVHSSADKNLFRVDFSAPEAKVLVVDDNEINLTIADGLLASMNIVPDHAHGGREAVEKTISGQYDIVFMDHMMPDVDGVEATIAIRKELNSMMHPVIMALSANVMEEARKLFKSAGMNDFVAKPIEIKDLAEKVKKWLPEEKIVARAEGEISDANEPGGVSGADGAGCVADRIEYEGLDTGSALRALGSPALYDKIIEEYYKSGSDKYAGIKQSYDSEDWEDYTIRVHALKSSSRQVGAMKLGDMAEELEKAGKASDLDTIKAKTADTLQEYSTFLEALGDYYGTAGNQEDEADKPLIDPDTLHGLMDEIKQACDDLDMDLMESVSERLAGYSYDDEKKSVIDELQQAISSMDTEKCEELIGVIS